MRYYLDVNAVYNYNNLSKEVQSNCFTSALAILEIVAGFNDKDFYRRKVALKNIVDNKVHVDWRLVESIMYDAFDILNEFEMLNHNITHLKEIALDCLAAKSFSDIKRKDLILYFKAIDKSLSNIFTQGRRSVNLVFRDVDTSIKFQEVRIELDKQKLLQTLFISDISRYSEISLKYIVNTVFSIIKRSKAIDKPTYSKEEIKASYNNLIDVFLLAFDRDFFNFLGVDELPGKNDLQDLYHLFYLREGDMIISDDKRFKKLIPELTLSLTDF